LILDVSDLKITNPKAIETELNSITGVVTNGLFAKHSLTKIFDSIIEMNENKKGGRIRLMPEVLALDMEYYAPNGLPTVAEAFQRMALIFSDGDLITRIELL
jgi:hypothetical protein